MKPINILFRFNFIFLIFLIISGCTATHIPIKLFNSYPQQDKINLVAQLVISEELKKSQIKDDFGADIIVLDFGENLVSNITNATKAVFTRVIINSNTNTSNVPYDISLHPKLILAKASYAQWKWDTGSVALGLEWTVLDKNGKQIWIDTVEGEASTKASIKDHIVVQMDMAIEELSLKSYNTLANSPVIQNHQNK